MSRGSRGVPNDDFPLSDAALQTGIEVIAAAKDCPEWRDVAENMVHGLERRLEAVRSPKLNLALLGLTAAIEEAGFSPPDKPPAKPKIGFDPASLAP